MDCLASLENSEVRRHYILKLDEDLLEKFIDNTILNACAAKSKCQVLVLNRILNRAVRPGWYTRYFIICIIGPDLCAIDRCNRLIERAIPEYHQRQAYRSKSNVTIYTNEWLPDNGNYSSGSMRIGGQRSVYGTLQISSPYAISKLRPKSNTPWKISRREIKGHYESGVGISQCLKQADKPPPDDKIDKLVSIKDIARFNHPNRFDRYATFKAVDNENINYELQSHCRKYINNLSFDATPPRSTRYSVMNNESGSVSQKFTDVQQRPSTPRRTFSFSRSQLPRVSTGINPNQPHDTQNSNKRCSKSTSFPQTKYFYDLSESRKSMRMLSVYSKFNRFSYYERLKLLRKIHRNTHRLNRLIARNRRLKTQSINSSNMRNTMNNNDELSSILTATWITEASISTNSEDNTLNSLKSL